MLGDVLRRGWPILPRSRPPVRPIFVLGSPRSGTTMLYSLLRASSEVRSLPGEGHVLWNLFHDERDPGWTSQSTPPDSITQGLAKGWP